VVSTASYLDFAAPDPDGRRITITQFGDPVAPANVSTASGRSATIFLDELGRKRRMELALGSDYANEVLVADSRAYDAAGRVLFVADPYAKSENPLSAYGTTYHYTDTGDLNCRIRGRGLQPLSMVSDTATEFFPTCFQRFFASNTAMVDVRDAASLQAGSPQAGVVKRISSTAIGRVIESSTLLAGMRLEDETFTYDRLGQPMSKTRFFDPVGATLGVQWSRRVDSLGETLELTEPESATRSYSYSDWGEPVEMHWLDSGIERRVVHSYDALGRLTATEERNDGVTDPETVNTYSYDVGVNVSPLVTPTFVLGNLARATSPSGEVTFGYDAFGRVNTQVFTDNDGGLYIEKAEHRVDGLLRSIEFNLPDRGFGREVVKYSYDSADRLRAIDYIDPSAGRQLYKANDIDIYGRVRTALYGENTTFHAVYANDGRRLIKEAAVVTPSGSRRTIFEQFDPIGREVSRREIKDGAATNTQITYDALGRLRDVMRVDGGITLPEWAYGYDPLGNLLLLRDFVGSAGATLSYRTGDRDRVCRIGYGPGGLGGTACNVAYDVMVNTIEQVTRTGVRRLEYFASGNVRHITEGAAQATFRYDPFGAVQDLDVIGAGVSDTRHDRRYGGLIELRNQGGDATTFTTRNIPGPDGIVASRRGAGDEWVFPFGEARGNRFFTYKNGEFLQDVEYEPFGEAKSSGKPPGSPYYTSSQWNGGDTLAAFGLSYLGARLYDPVIGRFLSRDPLQVRRTATTSNPYAFAANDPWNAADPSGLDCIGEGCNPDVPLIPGIALLGAAIEHVFAIAIGRGGSDGNQSSSYDDPKPQGPHTSSTLGPAGLTAMGPDPDPFGETTFGAEAERAINEELHKFDLHEFDNIQVKEIGVPDPNAGLSVHEQATRDYLEGKAKGIVIGAATKNPIGLFFGILFYPSEIGPEPEWPNSNASSNANSNDRKLSGVRIEADPILPMPSGVGPFPGNPTNRGYLDNTGRFHNYGGTGLPRPEDLRYYSNDELLSLRAELEVSVHSRILNNRLHGFNPAHAERQAEEQALIRSITKLLPPYLR
jgi:RHS repeat-associated protein